MLPRGFDAAYVDRFDEDYEDDELHDDDSLDQDLLLPYSQRSADGDDAVGAEAGEEDAEVAAAVGDAAWKAFLASGKRSPISSGTISATPRPEIRSPSEPWVFAIADVDAEEEAALADLTEEAARKRQGLGRPRLSWVGG